jgi:hypothetical protein
MVAMQVMLEDEARCYATIQITEFKTYTMESLARLSSGWT